MRALDSLFVFIAGVIVGAIGYNYISGERAPHNTMPPEKQQIVLERIQKVAKLITVEGEFNDTHEYNDYFWADIDMFSKKAIIKVKANVAVGFDLGKVRFVADDASRTIYVKDLPQPEILSIDHDAEYYDISEGMFNSFNEKELTALNDSIKSQLRGAVKKSRLMTEAKTDALDIIRMIIELSGWKMEIEYAPTAADSTRQEPPKNDNIDLPFDLPDPNNTSRDSIKN